MRFEIWNCDLFARTVWKKREKIFKPLLREKNFHHELRLADGVDSNSAFSTDWQKETSTLFTLLTMFIIQKIKDFHMLKMNDVLLTRKMLSIFR